MKYLVPSLVSVILFVSFGFSSAPNNSLAQEKFKSGIAGRVTDPSGAVIVGVNIRLVGHTTQTKVSVTTNDNGDYTADLEPELYDVEAEAYGFKKARRKNILVQPQARSFVDFMLEPKQE
jgi:hypothetical protein